MPRGWSLNRIDLACQHPGAVEESRRCCQGGSDLSRDQSLRTEVAFLANVSWLNAEHLGEVGVRIEHLEEALGALEQCETPDQAYGARRGEDLRELLVWARERAE